MLRFSLGVPGLVTLGGRFSGDPILFGNRAGALYDISDLSTLWTDSDQTTRVENDGDLVGFIADKSGNGNHITQSTAASRPTFKTNGSEFWLSFDSVNDYIGPAIFGLTQPWSRVSGLNQRTWTGGDRIFGGGTTARGLLYQLGTTPDINIFDGNVVVTNSNATLNTPVVVSEIHDGASSSLTVDNGIASTGNSGVDAFTGMTIGASRVGGQPSDLIFYGTLVVEGTLSGSELTDARNYMANLQGRTL